MPKTRHYGKPFAPYKKPTKPTKKKAPTKKTPAKKATTKKAAAKTSRAATTRTTIKPTGIKKPFKVSPKSAAGTIVERQKRQATRIKKMFQ